MKLTRFGISRPVVVRMALILIVVLGIYSYRAMPRYLDPDLSIGESLVLTVCPGYSPEDMEKLVTRKIEDELDGIGDIRRFESKSSDSLSKIHIFFNTRLSEYQIDQAMQDVRNAVDRVDDLPEEAKVPRVIEVDVAIFPVCLVGIAGDLPVMQLQDIAEKIKDTFESIDGVSAVDVLGKREHEIWVELDPRRMSTYGVSIAEVARAVANRTKNLPGGDIEMGDRELNIRMLGEPSSPENLGSIIVRSTGGGVVYLRDVAEVKPTLEKANALIFLDKRKGLVLAVKRKKNTNMIRIVDEVKTLMADLPRQYPGLRTSLYFDQSREIKRRISELQTNGLLGIMAVFGILWLSMGIRNALLASVGIPVSFLLTFICMKSFGLSIDAVTLFGLILVLGIVVDDAIVVLENIYRYVERGSPVENAALSGSREVLAPVVASVTTTMAAFFPLLFVVTGVIGRYLSILPKVVLFALAASLFEAFFMLPSHLVEWHPIRIRKTNKRRLDIFSPFRRLYYPMLRAILRHRYLSVLVIVLSTILAVFLYFQTDFLMFPKSDAFPRFNIYFDLPVGSSLKRTQAVLMGLSDLVKDRLKHDLDIPIAVAGMKEVNYEPIYGHHYGMLNVILKSREERKRSVVDSMESVRRDVERFLRIQGATALVLERMLEGPPVGGDVDLKIQASTWDAAAEISRRIQDELSRHRGIVDIQDNFSREKKLLEVSIDEHKAKNMGVDQQTLAMAIQAAFYGMTVATYHGGEEEQEIKMKYLLPYRKSFNDLVNLKLQIPGRGEAWLKDLARIRLVPGFHSIYHYNGKQTVQLTANIREVEQEKKGVFGFFSRFSGDRMTAVRANRIARDRFNSLTAVYPGARLIAGGLQDETNSSLRELGQAAGLALLLIFFILSLQFNSFSQPFIIMITIPFVVLGVIVGLLISGNPLTFVTLIGLLTLAGIVVNDSLVLIDFINRYRKDHPKDLYRAIVLACHVRMRPILLTSITTIFGLAPMALGLGGKSLFWAPLATAIMWGLGFSTLLILSMIPAYYAILEDIGYLIRHRKRRKADTLREIDQAFSDEAVKSYMKRS
jgi:multidrug efflux pump